MAYVRTKEIPPGSGRHYRYLQRSYREGGKVKTETVKYLGPANGPNDTGFDKSEIPEKYKGKIGTTHNKNRTTVENEVYGKNFEGDMSKHLYENRNTIFEANYKEAGLTKEEAKKEMKKALDQEGKSAEEIYVDEDEGKVYALGNGRYGINTYPEGNTDGPYNATLADDIHNVTDDAIHYERRSEKHDGQEYVITKKGVKKGTKKYKVYNYKDGDYIFIDNEKTKLDEVM